LTEAELERQKYQALAEQERQKYQALLAKLQAKGIDPDSL
jgi:hypothetical protein